MANFSTLLFLNGVIPKFSIVNKFLNKDSYIISADGASNKLKRMNIIPNVIIGDLDSINKTTLFHYKNKGSNIIEIIDQNLTDFEKCLIYCKENGLKEIIVFGSEGLRPDHAINNYSILKRYYKNLKINLIGNIFESFYIINEINFNYKIGEIVSLIPMPLASKVKTSGLLYPLNYENLELGIREGTLNKATEKKIKISFEKGDLLLIKKHFLS